jgi:nucleotide-binding universal stress UspA family protein
MAIRDILVCLDATEAGERRLKLAAVLAHRHNAHLAAAYPLADLGPDPAALYGPGAIGIPVAAAVVGAPPVAQPVAVAEIVEQRFRETLRFQGSGNDGEWHLLERGETAELIALAKSVDLIILGQHPPDATGEAAFRPEPIIAASGRPVLVVPYAGSFRSVGRRVLIAWDASREAARAVHDALPLIAGAEAVTVISVAPRESAMERNHPGLERIVRHLERHGLPASLEEDVPDGIPVGDVLLSRATDLGADLIVAGAYHHSQLREALIGGVSRELLQHMTVPVLMSH